MGNNSETIELNRGKDEMLSTNENNCIPLTENSANNDFDSENDISINENLVISESDGEASPQKKATIEQQLPESNIKKFVADKVLRDLCSSESELEDMPDNSSSQKIGKRYAVLSDSESEIENENKNYKKDKPSSNIDTIKIDNEKRSEKVAMKDITAIKSETQRLSRENEISVPYHKPKQYTLKQFLTRKTISKPGISKPVNLKMSQEELKEYAKHLEEREKEASEFFKSDAANETKTREDDSSVENDKKDIAQSSLCNEVLDDNTKGMERETKELQLSDVTKRKSESCIIATNKTDLKPVLKGDPNMLIDLETGDLISVTHNGVDKLLQRYMKSSIKSRTKQTDNLSILRMENAESAMSPSSIGEEIMELTENKPGSAYLKLKNELKKVIIDKRKQELIKKSQGNDILVAQQMEQCDENGEHYKNETTSEVGKEDIDVDENEELLFNEAEESDADDELDSSESDSGEDYEGFDDPLPKKERFKSRSRIVAAFEDSDEETEKLTKEIDDILKENSSDKSDKLLWTDPEGDVDGDGELLELCSGKFEQTPQTSQTEDPDSQNNSLGTKQRNYGVPLGNSKDDDFNLSEENVLKQSVKKGRFRKRKKLGFSDEENDSDSVIIENETTRSNENSKKSEEPGVEEDESDSDISENQTLRTYDSCEKLKTQEDKSAKTYIDYDSEENEIEVEVPSTDLVQKVTEFFEDEAELSESDWGSADEDEKDLDRYDIELGDEEQYDKQKLQTELGQIHLRKMLDQDMREVKKIQELFLEDEENNGVGRQRRFRWKKEETGFSLDKPLGEDNIEGNKSEDEENEADWRKMRYERELILKDKSQPLENELLQLPVSSDTKTLCDVGCKETSEAKIKLNTTNEGTSANLSIIVSKKATSARGSFLIRDKNTLLKLASITKSGVESDLVAGSCSISAGRAKNFIFTSISDTENLACKRKFSDSAKNCFTYGTKKQKILEDTEIKTTLIDHLL